MKNNKDTTNGIDWGIRLYTSGTCDNCGEVTTFLPYTCNAYTDGMSKYGHMEFQLVLCFSPEDIAYILNRLGERVQSGEVFHPGDLVSRIFKDCRLRLDEFKVSEQRVLRVIVPDENNHFPEEDCCNDIYKLQLLDTESLYWEGGVTS